MAAGYENATITQILSIIIFFTTFLSGNQVPLLSLDLNRIVKYGELWRLITSHFVYRNLAQAFVALILLYTCRQFERQMGAKKFGAFLCLSLVLVDLFLIIFGLIANAAGVDLNPAPGPYFIVFSLLFFYYKYIPKLQPTKYHFFGNIHISEKSWIYLLSSQLFLNEGVNSVFISLIGVFVAFLYDRNIFGCQKFRLPTFIEKIFEFFGKSLSFFLPLSGQNPRGAIRNPRAVGANRGFTPQVNVINNRENDDIPFQLPPPDEESITALLNLGFEREQAIDALRRTGNNVDAAANLLLR